MDWALDSIIDTREIEWQRHYAALLEYYKEHGTCNVHNSNLLYKCELPNMGYNGGTFHYKDRLYGWLSIQRAAMRNEGYGLTGSQTALLQAFVDEGILLLIIFNFKKMFILKFIYYCCYCYLIILGKLKISFTDENKKKTDETWQRNYDALLHYIYKHGNSDIPNKFIYECILPNNGNQNENGDGEDSTFHYKSDLGSWLVAQKTVMKNTVKPMPPARLEKLQKLIDEGNYY